MALTLEEQVRIQEEKVRILREKIKKEEKRKNESIGMYVRKKFPGITEDAFDETMKKAMAVSVSPEDKVYMQLGKIIASKMPQYFSVSKKAEYENIADTIAKFLERNKQYLNL